MKGLQNQQLSISITHELGQDRFSKDIYVAENDLILDFTACYKPATGSYIVVQRSNDKVYSQKNYVK